MKEKDAAVWSNKFKALLLGCGIFIVALLVLIVILLVRSPTSDISNETDNQTKSELIVQKVGDIYLLPDGEAPTVAAIQDKTKMTDNREFFMKAENGDYLLVYKEAKLALIYRESENKLINVAPVNFEAESGQLRQEVNE